MSACSDSYNNGTVSEVDVCVNNNGQHSDNSCNSSPEIIALDWKMVQQIEQNNCPKTNDTSNSSPELFTLDLSSNVNAPSCDHNISGVSSPEILQLNSNSELSLIDECCNKSVVSVNSSPEIISLVDTFGTRISQAEGKVSNTFTNSASSEENEDDENLFTINNLESNENNVLDGTVKSFHDQCSQVHLQNENSNDCVKVNENCESLHVNQSTSDADEVARLRETVEKLKLEISRLEGENQRLEADRSHEVYAVQLEALERTISQQRTEIEKVERASKQQAAQAEQATKQHSAIVRDLQEKLEKTTKQLEASKRETESAVVRFAVSEKELIEQRKEREVADRRLKEATKEREAVTVKLRAAAAEKTRICQMLDAKCHELSTVQKENERLRDDLNSRDIKIKWIQNKLRTETDTHKETQAKVDRLTRSLAEAKEECEQVRKDCQEMIRAYQHSEENRAFTLDQQLKEQQAKLILERHEREDKEELAQRLQQELEVLKTKHEAIIAENNSISIKLQNLEKERLEREQILSRLRQAADSQQQDVADLRAQLAEMGALRMQLAHEQERLQASQEEVERLRQSNQELQQEAAACREREAELLDFTQRLTDKNVRLQSEFSATEAKARELELETARLTRQNSELQQRLSASAAELEAEKMARQHEAELLARALAERTALAERLEQQCNDLRGEKEIAARKHAATVKELNREMQQLRRRHECCESPGLLGPNSRTSSCSSLPGSGSEAPSSNHTTTAVQVGLEDTPSVSVTTLSNGSVQPDTQALIDRIVRLQRSVARKTEKLEFLEENTRQLVAELQRKSRLVQEYVLREQAGALAPQASDNNKMEMARHGGIMASLYSSKPADSNMTLELSLEINRKLQAVLEDTLLKNITLKENIDTLGKEIARLTNQKNANNNS